MSSPLMVVNPLWHLRSVESESIFHQPGRGRHLLRLGPLRRTVQPPALVALQQRGLERSLVTIAHGSGVQGRKPSVRR